MSQTIIHNNVGGQTPTKQILHSGVWKSMQQSILHNGVWDTGAQFVQVYSGGHSPIANDLTSTGATGVISTWTKIQLKGAPIGVKVHIRTRYKDGDLYRPNFRAMVGAQSTSDVSTVANCWHPSGGNVVSETGWKKATWGGNSSKDAAACNVSGVSIAANIGAEIVSDVIPISGAVLQADGSCYFVLCVEQTVASAPLLGFGTYATRTSIPLLNAGDGVSNLTYWDDLYFGGTASVLAVTNAPLTAPAIPSSTSGTSNICAWLEPVYSTQIRSFLSTGDSTHSCAYSYNLYSGWIGNAVRYLNTLGKSVCTYQGGGGSGHSYTEFMNIFDDCQNNTLYSDVIIQGWSQNGFVASAVGVEAIRVRLQAAVAAARAKNQRVWLTLPYCVPGYTTAEVHRQSALANVRAMCDGVNVIAVDLDSIISDYSGTYPVIKSIYQVDASNVHCNLAGQQAMAAYLRGLLAATL